jgi:hypothetical protein
VERFENAAPVVTRNMVVKIRGNGFMVDVTVDIFYAKNKMKITVYQ